ncbi:MAG: hypothetical protein ABIP94_15965 [Planctomycetota bacterium]
MDLVEEQQALARLDLLPQSCLQQGNHRRRVVRGEAGGQTGLALEVGDCDVAVEAIPEMLDQPRLARLPSAAHDQRAAVRAIGLCGEVFFRGPEDHVWSFYWA